MSEIINRRYNNNCICVCLLKYFLLLDVDALLQVETSLGKIKPRNRMKVLFFISQNSATLESFRSISKLTMRSKL